jgi:hypothetical protein
MKRLLIFLLVFGFANTALGQAWVGNQTTARVGGVYYYEFSDTTDSSLLNVQVCESLFVSFNSDTTGTNTGCEIYVMQCEVASISANHCSETVGDANGDGIIDATDRVTLTGAIGRQGFRYIQTKPQIYIKVEANPSSDSCRATVRCNDS